MKRYLYIILIFTLLCSCIQKKRGGVGADGRRQISVSIVPLKYFIDSISGGDFYVNVIVPPGVCPESYEPLPSQMKSLEASELYFHFGLTDFERMFRESVERLGTGIGIVDLSQGIPLMDSGGKALSADQHPDPHMWMSPQRMKIAAMAISEKLSFINPGSSDKYETNCRELISRIDSADRYARMAFDTVRSRAFVVDHSFMTYFAADYGLEQLALETEGKQDKEMDNRKRIEDAVDNLRLPVIFYHETEGYEMIRHIAEERKVEAKPINPMEYRWLENIFTITDGFREAMR